MSPDDIAPLFDTWLPKAERWLENERDKPITCLILWYQIKVGEKNRGWSELPELYRKQFEKAGRSQRRIADREYLEIAYRGEMTGWKELLGNIDEICRQVIQVDSADYLQRLSSVDRWVMILFHLLQLNALGDSLGGRRMNLDPRFKLSFGDWNPTGDSIRFPVDQPLGGGFEEFSRALKESADNHGFFATIDDLRIVSVAALRWLKKKRDQLSEGNTGRKSRRKRDQTEHQLDWEKVVRDYDNFSKPTGYKQKKPGGWTAKFEALWQSREDLQAWNLNAAWENYDAARKRIDRRSRH